MAPPDPIAAGAEAALHHDGVDAHLESSEYLEKRSLRKGSAGWVLLAGLGVSYVISGDYAGWNNGLAEGGFGGLLVAAIVIAFNWVLYVTAVTSGNTSEAALGYFLNPLVTVGLGVVFLGERLRALQWVAVAIGLVAGIYLAVAGGRIPLMALGMAFSFAIYSLTKKKVVTASTSIGTGENSIPNRLKRGEIVDIVIVSEPVLRQFIKDGLVLGEGWAPVARSTIGMAVRAGAPKPDISSVDALRRTLLKARSIGYSASVSGQYLTTELYQRLGIADQVLGASIGDDVTVGRDESARIPDRPDMRAEQLHLVHRPDDDDVRALRCDRSGIGSNCRVIPSVGDVVEQRLLRQALTFPRLRLQGHNGLTAHLEDPLDVGVELQWVVSSPRVEQHLDV